MRVTERHQSSTSRVVAVTPALLVMLASLVMLVPGCPGSLFPIGVVPPNAQRVDVVALAGPDLVVVEGQRVALTGAASRALTGDPTLSWAQLAGPSVLLTNPSSQLPAFIAPLAPATLTFQLRATAAGKASLDTVTVTVDSLPPSSSPVLLSVPADAVAAPGSQHSFAVDVIADGPVTLSASTRCDDGASVSLDGATVTVVLPGRLPCTVVVDGVDASGRGVAPAARVFWPEGTALPAETQFAHDNGSPTAATLFFDPGAPAAIAFTADDAPGSHVRAWSAAGDDDVIPGGVDGDNFAFTMPRRAGRIIIGGERRIGGASGRVRYLVLDVDDGPGNVAPVARGGPDRIVLPGARFRLDTSASSDLDNDPLITTITQVLGPTATPDPLVPGVFTAPAGGDDTLLFHVVVDDGTVLSAPDAVRVLVSSGAQNLAPVLTLPAQRFVTPGQSFVVDASRAEDPDSGIVSTFSISQAQDDAVVLPPFADGVVVTEPLVELTAGAAGEVYHLQIAAFDEEGLGVTVQQTITVEDAGPYVDPIRGDDAAGNGTIATPFATVAAAISTAVHHELPELLLAEGRHASIGAVLPERVSLRGGQHFNGTTYVDGGAVTVLPVGEGGLGIVGAHLVDLDVELAAGSVTLQHGCNFTGVHITELTPHAEPLVVVKADAEVTLRATTVTPLNAHDATVVLEPSSSASFQDSAVRGAPGAAVGVSCTGATVSLDNSLVVGASIPSASGTGVRASDGCHVDATSSTIAGGVADATIGIDASESFVSIDGDSHVVGALDNGVTATALSFSGRRGSALLRGSIDAGAATAVLGTAAGLVVTDAQVSLEGAHVGALGAAAEAIHVDGGVFLASATQIESAVDGVVIASADDIDLAGSSVNAGGRAVVASGVASITLSGMSLSGSAGVDAAEVGVVLLTSDVVVSGASGVLALTASVSDSTISVRGAAAGALDTSATALDVRGAALVQRTSLLVSGAPAIGLIGTAAMTLESTYVAVSSTSASAAGDVAVKALGGVAGAVALRHATLRSDAGALAVSGLATLDAANSVLAGDPGIDAAAPFAHATALAFRTGSTFVTTGATTQADLDALGCDICMIVDTTALIDATGHLSAGDNALVDAADATLSLPDDIDGDLRPQGPAPDIGSDERVF